MSHDKSLQLIQTGRMAQIVLDQFKEKIDSRKAHALSKLTQLSRSGCSDPVALASRLAAYCELEDFETELTKEVTRARKAAEEMNGTREPANPHASRS